MASFVNDVRHGCRILLKNPGFALIAIASIAIGVGANAAIFSLADGLLLRPLGVPQPRQVLSIVGTTRETGFQPPGLSYPDYVDLRGRTRTFEDLVAYRDVLAAFDARPDQPALRTLGAAVSGNLFTAMRIRPAHGRFFTGDEDRVPGRDAVVVLDHRAWTERFGADPSVIGRRVRISDVEFTVIGVTPPSFRGLALDVWPTFYVPMAMVDRVQRPSSSELTRRDLRALDVKGRLRDGATLAQAREEIARLGADLAAAHPEINRARGLAVRTELELRASGPDAMLLTMLMVLAAAVLVVACANLAGLLTSRAPVRAREIALRLAIGAGRLRLVRQLIVESLVIAVGGAAAGLVIAYGGILLFRRIELPTEVPLKLYFDLDQRVVVLGMVVAAASAVAASLIPAWQATRTDLVSTIKWLPSPAGRSRQWGRQSLVCLQVALSLILVTVAAALQSGFEARVLQGPGFRTERLLMMRFDERLAQYDSARSRQFYRQLKERAGAIAGVESVALTSSVPLKVDTAEAVRMLPEGVRLPDDASDTRVRSSRVDEQFFDTIGIPILQGRAFATTDSEDGPPVAVVNQALAARYWPGQQVIGRRLRIKTFDDSGEGRWHEIVGVAADAK